MGINICSFWASFWQVYLGNFASPQFVCQSFVKFPYSIDNKDEFMKSPMASKLMSLDNDRLI